LYALLALLISIFAYVGYWISRRNQGFVENDHPNVVGAFVVGLSGFGVAQALFYIYEIAFRGGQATSILPPDLQLLGLMALLWVGCGTIVTFFGVSSYIEQTKKKIATAEAELATTDDKVSFREFLNQRVKRTRLREDITLGKAEVRSDQLYRLGATLMIMSVAWPFVGVFIYWSIDPLPRSTIEHLAELHKSLGGLPDSLLISSQRDWRLLFGGISIGFLFLAASAAILRQKTKEVAIMEKAAAKVSYYERVESLLALEARDKSADERRLLTFVQKQLLADRSGLSNVPEVELDGEDYMKSFTVAVNQFLKGSS
jgi:hypothetical protein